MSDKNKKLFYIASGSAIMLILVLVGIFSFLKNGGDRNFAILTTTPQNGEQNIKPEEILIKFTTDKPVASISDFSISVSPPVNSELKTISTFPSQTVTTQALGGLQPNTTYTVTVTNTFTNQPTTWSFTTSSDQPESSSGAFNEEQEELIVDYYPLLSVIPYETDRVYVTYTDRLTLQVKIKKNEVEAIKQEVNDWIRSQGVDPSTHTLNYENAF